MKPETTYTTDAELRRAIGVSKGTMSRYLNHRDDWPVSREPPWSEGDVQVIHAWRETLQPDMNHYHDDNRRRLGPGVPAYVEKAYTYPFIQTHGNGCPIIEASRKGSPVDGMLAAPEPICLPIERDVIEGRRVLTPDEQRMLMYAVVSMKFMIFDNVNYLNGLASSDTFAARNELNRRAHVHAEMYRDNIEEIFGRDAAGTRPKWEQWMRVTQWERGPDGMITITSDEPAEPDEYITEAFAEYDAKRKKGKQNASRRNT